MFYQKYFFMKPFFEAEGGQGGGGNGSAGTGATDEGNSGTGSDDKGGEGSGDDKSFDDLLKDKKHQSEFDKRIAKAIEAAKSKWDVDNNVKMEEAKTEAEKLAKMTAEQKAEYQKQKREDELAKRENEISVRELKAQAYETLAEKGLPKELVDILNYESADTCSKSIESVEKAFQAAVEKSVNEKLRSKEPPRGGSGAGGNDEALRKAFGLQ